VLPLLLDECAFPMGVEVLGEAIVVCAVCAVASKREPGASA
jgi:hypothetical protein